MRTLSFHWIIWIHIHSVKDSLEFFKPVKSNILSAESLFEQVCNNVQVQGRRRREPAYVNHNINNKINNKMKVKWQHLTDDCHI